MERKNLRLGSYDYSQNGAYFITVCTKDREPILSQIVVADDPVRLNDIHLTQIGKIVSDCWNSINNIFPNVKADKFVIMPNHFHGIIIIDEYPSMGGQGRPPLQKIVQGFKSVTTRRCFPLGYSVIWQRSFYDHIIRDENEYIEVWEYIDGNSAKWEEDDYYYV
jgi:putative transposase